MSTRGCVAVGSHRTWRGLYNHSDSDPGNLGAEVWKIIRAEDARGNLDYFCRDMLRWFRWENVVRQDSGFDDQHMLHISSKSPNPLHISWVYVIDPIKRNLYVLGSKEMRRPEPHTVHSRPGGPVRRRDGSWDYGHCRYKHRHVMTLPLGTSATPNWYMIGNYINAPDLFDSTLVWIDEPKVVSKTSFERVLDDDLV